MASGFTPNRAGLEALAMSPGVRAAVRAVAEQGRVIAEGLAQDFRVTGDYADSFTVDTTDVTVGDRFPHRAAAAVLRNTSGHAAAVEWGYEGRSSEPSTSAHHVLHRTLGLLEHP